MPTCTVCTHMKICIRLNILFPASNISHIIVLLFREMKLETVPEWSLRAFGDQWITLNLNISLLPP